MQRVIAIARHTFWEGVRMRVVLVTMAVLIVLVPIMSGHLKGDGTVAGRLQNFLSWSLGALSVLLSLATIFFSCATLTHEFASKSLHMIVTKPVSRLEILAGKWLGVNALALLVILLSGLMIYVFAWFIRQEPVKFERDRYKITDTVWTSRIAADPTVPDFEPAAREHIDALAAQGSEFVSGREFAVQERVKELREQWINIPPGYDRAYQFENIPEPDNPDAVLQVRFRMRAIPMPMDEMIDVGWAILDPETGAVLQTLQTRERQSQRHQFLVRSRAVIGGKAVIAVANAFEQGRSIYFEGDDSFQLLYKVGSFEGNYVKTLALIQFRLAFLSAIALFFGTFVGYPVACFCVLCMYVFCLFAPWWFEAIGANLQTTDPRYDPYGGWGPLLRGLLLPPIRFLAPNFAAYDGVDSLIDGFRIAPELIARAAGHTLLYGVALLGVPGWLIFRSREVAQTIV